MVLHDSNYLNYVTPSRVFTPENFELKFMFAIILPLVGLGIEYETFIPRKPQTNEELIINTKLTLV